MAKLNIKKLGKAVLERGGGGLVGGAAGAAANKVMPASMNPIVKGVLKAAVGAVIPELSPKSEFMKAAGTGMVGQAGGELFDHFTSGSTSDSSVKGTETISGDAEYIVDEEINGTDDEVQVISGDGEEVEYVEGVEGTEDEEETMQ